MTTPGRVTLKIPGLQCFPSRHCVVCHAKSEFYCSQCGVTPYCSPACQRKDWPERHKNVCHNLIRLSAAENETNKTEEAINNIPPPAPLRRPRDLPNRDDDSPDRSKTKFIPDNRAEFNNARKNNNKSNKNNYNNRNRNNRNAKPNIKKSADDDEDETWDMAKSKTNGEENKTTNIKPECSRKLPEPNRNVIVPNRKMPEPVAKVSELVAKVSEAVAKKSEPVAKSPEVNCPPKQREIAIKQDIIPKHYMVEKLQMGETIVMSVETETSEGFLCIAIHSDFEDDFNKLCNEYGIYCEKDDKPYSPSPGDVFSYLDDGGDGGWYRARCVSVRRAALLDAGRIVQFNNEQCRRIKKEYTEIPEYTVLLVAKVTVGTSLRCKLLSKTTDGYKVSISDENDKDLGTGEVKRWSLPIVRETVTPAAPFIPSVPRPPLRDASRYVLLDVTSLKRACVRPADNDTAVQFDSILHDVILHALKVTKPLQEPPQKGDTVISKFTDGNYYRALVKRTNVKQNKYLIEYVEYGNEEKCPLENLYPCPSKLDIKSSPAIASIVELSEQENALTPPAVSYIDKLKEDCIELILTTPNGSKSVPSGSLVNLTVERNKESVNKKLEELCTPDWKKLEKNGGDVLETKHIMFKDLEYVKLPTDKEFVLQVVEYESLEKGSVCGYLTGEPMVDIVYEELTKKMNEYCNSDLCKEPYLPKCEELCITKYSTYPQWFRAVLLELTNGPGSDEARVYYIDYGNIDTVPVSQLRKMLPEFVNGYPAVAVHVDIKNFPEKPTPAQLLAALEVININDEGRGTLRVKRCTARDACSYIVEVPDVIAAVKSV